MHVRAAEGGAIGKRAALFELGRGAELRELLDRSSASSFFTSFFSTLGAPSTTSFASLRPRPVSARTSLMTLILALASKLVSLMSKNSLFLRGGLGRRRGPRARPRRRPAPRRRRRRRLVNRRRSGPRAP